MTNRIPSLDGIRAVSIVFVLIAHLTGTQNFPAAFGRASVLGNLGVRVFFVLSGFLITQLLLKEFDKSGEISLKRFYFRRVMRILPAFYAFLVFVAIGSSAGWWDASAGHLIRAGLFLSNYQFDRTWELGHTWSLAVEEQFYLLWPAILAIWGLAPGRRTAIAVIAAAPAIRIAVYFLAPDLREMENWAFPTVCDTLAAGCLLACSPAAGAATSAYGRFLRSRWFWSVPALVMLANLAQHSTLLLPLSYAIGQTLMNLGIACIIDRFVRVPDDFAGRLLNAAPVAFVGTISYSLYLWQQLFLNRHASAAWAAFPLNLVLAFGAAVACHFFVEKPFLAWRARLESKRPARRTAPVLATAPLGQQGAES